MIRTRLVRISLAIIILSASDIGFSSETKDPRVVWLRDATIPIRSIAPEDEDFSDLKPIEAALDGARVVLLGEADHGDGNTFLLKTRSIRFLHEKQGFDVLAFESGFYDCWKAWQRVEGGADPATAFRQSVFRIWTRSVQVQPLINYFSSVAHSSRPLVLTGIDPQFTDVSAGQQLLDDLGHLADVAGMSGDLLVKRISTALTNLADGKYEFGEIPKPEERSAMVEALKDLENRLRNHEKSVPERDFWLHWLASIGDFAEVSWRTRS